jgi:hypothetical protein
MARLQWDSETCKSMRSSSECTVMLEYHLLVFSKKPGLTCVFQTRSSTTAVSQLVYSPLAFMLVTLLAFSFISFAGGRLRDRKDIDLVIRRSILTKECSFISSQPCRTKLVNDALECTYSHQQPAPKSWRQIGEEEMAIYPALDENSLWLLAESICGIDINSNCSNIVDNTPGFDSGSLQEVLSHSKRATIEDDAIANGESPPLDIESLHISGLSSNRVNLVFFSDGCMYTAHCVVYKFIRGPQTDMSEEQSKFMDDAARLAQDIIGNQTFSTVKPLLNIWAAFSPSNEVFTFCFFLWL